MEKDDYLRGEGLSKSFSGMKAIVDLSFSIEKGKITSFIGPNGAGKTTVYNLIMGRLKPDSGRIFFKGRNITNLPAYQVVKLGLARTFQDLRILNKLTVRQNILIGLPEIHQQRLLQSIFGWRSKEMRTTMVNKVEQLIEFMGLREVADELAENISYAEQKFVVLARALATDADLLLLDEPAAGIAQDSMKKMMTLFHQIVDNGKTILLVEHNMNVVLSISDYVIVLDFGKKIATGTPEEIKNNDRVIKVYLGVP